MSDQGDSKQVPAPLWAVGDMLLRVSGGGAEPDRLVKVDRPFAVIGRARDADIVINDRAASAHHAYLHLDARGVYVVDLVTRTGTRLKGADHAFGWLRPGDAVEVAGRKVELLRMRVGGATVEPPPCSDDLLADGGRSDLPGVTLEPLRSAEPPWVLGSELVFLGWSASCGIQVRDPAVARAHCALVRSRHGAFLVDLCGRQTWVEDRPVTGAFPLADGDLITLGATQFTVKIEPPETSLEGHTQLAMFQGPDTWPVPFGPPPMPGRDLAHADPRGALLAWMVNAIEGGQRRQGEFQLAVTEALRQIQQDSATLLTAHLERIESIDREITSLRAELQRRNAPPSPPSPPAVEPLRIARPDPAEAPPTTSAASTAWLLDRVGQLESENKSAWRDLIGRLSQAKKAP